MSSPPCRVHLAGREIAALRTKLSALAAARHDGAQAEAALKSELARLDTEVMAASAELSARGADDLSDRLVRVEQLRERARGLAAVIAERRRGVERDRGQLLDADVVASLEGDAAGYREELEVVEAELTTLRPALDVVAADEAALAAERQGVFGLFDPAPATAAASAIAEVRGELRSRRAATERAEADLRRSAERAAALTARLADVERQADDARHDCNAAELAETPLLEEIARVEDRQRALDVEAEAVETAHRRAREHASSWSARVDALQLALDAAHARAGAECLAGAPGVLGPLFDLVRIDAGWEQAVEAALGEALDAVVATDAAAAARAFDALRRADTTGAVLALGLAVAAGEDPPAGDPVRPHVTADRVSVNALLDRLLGGSVRVDDVDAAVDLAYRYPTATVVTADGDRLGPSGWRLGAASSGGVTAAALTEAITRAEQAERETERCRAEQQRVETTRSGVRRHLDELTVRLEANDARMTAASEALARVHAERREAEVELGPLEVRAEEGRAHLAADRERIAELEQLLPDLEAGELAEADAARTRHEARVALDARTAVLVGRRRDLEVRAAGLGERAQLLRHRLQETERRLAADADARATATHRREGIERTLAALERLTSVVDGHRAVVEAHHGALVERRRHQTEEVMALSGRLDELRTARGAAERALDETRERTRRAEVDEAEARLRLESAVEMLRHDFDVEPAVAEATDAPALPEGVSAQARARELDRELRLLGPINPLALEEFTELQQRHTFLEEQLEDVKTTRRELNRVIRAVDHEIQTVFAAAYADVSANFTSLFTTLFPGGSGRLVLTEPDDLLATGIEVEARPGGKNVKKLSLLSGGERSLTALAFLFAVFRSRPSPFYVMDEVEAALDDVNLHRFLGLVAEFRREAQLLVVSHQKRTMEAGDCLLGVTMQPGGSSKVITERVGTPA